MEKNYEQGLTARYNKMVEGRSPNSRMIINCAAAFLVGGLICDVGQLFSEYFLSIGMNQDTSASYVSSVMIFLGAFLTGIGVYDDLGKFAGAGSIVPITGFANSIVSPAMEYKREGLILGVAAKMFIIAGPVLVYGISSSILAGLIYYIIR